MGRQVAVCEADEVRPGRGTTVRAAGREIAVFNVDGEFYAIDAVCTHEGGPLGEGTLMGTTVSCPWHYAAFDVTTGDSLDPIAPCGVESHPVQEDDGRIMVEITWEEEG